MAVAVTLLVSTSVYAQQSTAPALSDATKRLFEAVMAKDIVAVRLSLNDGADIKAINRDGLTAADLAVDSGYFEIAHLILNSRNQPQPEAEPGSPMTEQASASNSGEGEQLPPPPAPLPAPAPNSAPASVDTPIPSAPAPGSQVSTGLPPAVPVDAGRPKPVRPTTASWPDGKPNPFEQKAAAGLPVLHSGAANASATPNVTSVAAAQPVSAPTPAQVATAETPTRQAPTAVEAAPERSESPAAPEPTSTAKPTDENLMTEGSQVSPVSSAAPPQQGPVEHFLKNLSTILSQDGQHTNQSQPAPTEVARVPEPKEEAVKPTPPPPPPTRPRHILENVPLTFGKTEIVGRTPGLDRFDSPDCFRHGDAQTYFCVEDVDWAPDIAGKMDVRSTLYDGRKTIVRYDHGRATRAFSVFPSKNFADVVAYFERRFGEPTEREEKRRSLLAHRHKPNLILRWESRNEGDGRLTVLELRNFDDVRNRIPDKTVSVVRVYDENSTEIFETLSDRVFLLRRGVGDFRLDEPTTQTKTLN